MMDCKRYEQFILAYIDDELDVLQKKELERHLETCEHCAHCLSRLKHLRSRLRNLPKLQTSETFQIVLRECIRRRAAGRPALFGSQRPLVWRIIPVAGAALFLIVISVGLIDQQWSPKKSRNAPTLLTRIAASGNRSEPQIQYILEDYPNRISIARDDSERNAQRAEYDSLLQRSRSDDPQNRITTVSF